MYAPKRHAYGLLAAEWDEVKHHPAATLRKKLAPPWGGPGRGRT